MDAVQLADLYRRFAPLVHARALRLLGNEADDVVQETFLRLLDRRLDAAQIPGWIVQTSTNLAIDKLRHRQRRSPEWMAELARSILSAPSRPIDEILADRELCRRLLVKADAKTRTIAAMRYFDGMDQEEIASALGVSSKTVSERLQRFHAQALKVVRRWQS